MKRTLETILAVLADILLAVACVAALAALAPQAHGQNIPITVRASAAATTTVTTADQTNASWRGAYLVVNATGLSSGSFTPKVQGKDLVSGSYYDIVTGSAISGTGTTVLKVYPGITPTTGTVADLLPYTWRVQLVGASSPVGTLSIGGFLAP